MDVNIDYNAARFWMDLVQIMGIVGLAFYTHITSKSKANREAINVLRQDLEAEDEKLEQRIVAAESRISVLDNQLHNAPDHEDMGKVYERLNQVSGDVQKLSGQLSGLINQLTMINEYLLKDKNGGK